VPADDEAAFQQDLQQARNGDRMALDRLLQRLEDQIPGQASRQIGSGLRGRTRPSDLAQNAYVEILRQIESFRGSSEAALRAWAAKILQNAARQEHRRLTAKRRKAPSRTSPRGSFRDRESPRRGREALDGRLDVFRMRVPAT
jgi:DNA-directed RNA polymerase specialized sigma24 family protein